MLIFVFLLAALYAAFWLGVLGGEKGFVRVWWPGRGRHS